MKKLRYIIFFLALIIIYLFSAHYVFKYDKKTSVALKELTMQAKVPFRLNPKCLAIIKNKEYQIIGGANLDLPDGYLSSSSAKLIVLHGINYKEIAGFIQSEKFKDSSNQIIITALALKRCLLEKDSPLFTQYLENYKKNGDILANQGTPFYYLEQLKFKIKDNLSGIVISFPADKYLAKVKNYALAHMIQSNFSLQGLQNPLKFLEAIHFPKPKGFEGSFNDLITLARQKYQINFQDNIIDISFTEGKIVSRKLLPFITPRKANKYLPLFKALKLAGNIYFSGLIKSE